MNISEFIKEINLVDDRKIILCDKLRLAFAEYSRVNVDDLTPLTETGPLVENSLFVFDETDVVLRTIDFLLDENIITSFDHSLIDKLPSLSMKKFFCFGKKDEENNLGEWLVKTVNTITPLLKWV